MAAQLDEKKNTKDVSTQVLKVNANRQEVTDGYINQ